ncbi:MAG: TauD/TfdA family dioxygenase [Hyphomicrobiales bacterium]
MTPIHRERIPRPQAWKSTDFKSKEDLVVALGEAQLAALRQGLARVNAERMAVKDITKREFDFPALADFLAPILAEIRHGRGAAILRGLPVKGVSEDAVAAMYWGLGTHLGVGLSQSAVGDVLGNVVDATDNGRKAARGYRSNRELWLHTDNAELVGLCCVRQAKEGGVSLLANALAIHNEILAARPDYLVPLYEGFRYHRRGEEGEGDAPITPYNVPLFSNCDGEVSCFFLREAMVPALRDLNEQLTPPQKAALDYFDEVSLRDDMVLRFTLQPGEVLFFNNYTLLHARTEFVNRDEPGEQRHLMRLWLDVPNGRKVVPQIHIYENEGGRGGIDRQEGRGRAKEQYLFSAAEARALQTSRIW